MEYLRRKKEFEMNKRNRWVYFFLVFVIMGVGFLLRKFIVYFFYIVNIYVGDLLWVLMIFVSVGFLFFVWRIKMIGMFVIVFCYFIEFI